jgi:hypothetical protein
VVLVVLVGGGGGGGGVALAVVVVVAAVAVVVVVVCVAQPQCAQTMLASRVGTMEMDSRDEISPPVRSSRAR